MINLRDQTAKALHEHRLTKIGPYGDAFDEAWEFERSTRYGESIYEQADVAIATVFTALLNDECVLAVRTEIQSLGAEPEFVNRIVGAYRHSMRAAQAALTAEDAKTGEEDSSNE